jgi:hypothetical protein
MHQYGKHRHIVDIFIAQLFVVCQRHADITKKGAVFRQLSRNHPANKCLVLTLSRLGLR